MEEKEKIEKLVRYLLLQFFVTNLIKEKDSDKIINQIVEESLRKACKELRRKGIETVMSSANKTNLLNEGEKALEKEYVKGKEFIANPPTFKSVCKGYVWIMINFLHCQMRINKYYFLLKK